MAKFKDVSFTDPDATFRVSYSGGKDSTAMLIMLLQKGFPVTSIDFLDSEWEYPEVYEYIEKVNKYVKEKWGKEINYLKLKKEWKFERWFYGKYMSGQAVGEMRGFPFVLGGCYLSRQKGRTLDRYDKTSYRYIGIGWNERHRETNDPLKLYPLIEWGVTEEDCKTFLKEQNLYPEHNKYYTRNGCWWCPKQSLASARSLYLRHPDLWEELKRLESISPRGWGTEPNKVSELEERFKKELEEEKYGNTE